MAEMGILVMHKPATYHKERVKLLHQLYQVIVTKDNTVQFIKGSEQAISLITPFDIMYFVHELVLSGDDMEIMKTGINKLLNVTYNALNSYPYQPAAIDTYFGVCTENNRLMVEHLDSIRPLLTAYNKEPNNAAIRKELSVHWKKIQPFTAYYIIKENVLFPLIEAKIEASKCVAMMWSFHDDIKRNIDDLINLLDDESQLDLRELNRLSGVIFFNMFAIKFREERILFPFIATQIPQEDIENLWNESVVLGFPYYNPDKKTTVINNKTMPLAEDSLDLKTGLLTLEQLMLIFKHLPVDITYVDEHDKVRFFSDPPHRIFTRTPAVIGRDVHNCHPHESVHIVEKIVESFRNGTQDHADFWIDMRGRKILIQYFAVRDEKGSYRGVMEVSQEITKIQALEGQRRILDWQ